MDESSDGSTTESKALPTWSAGMDSRRADRAKSTAEVVVFTYVLSLIWGISLKFTQYLLCILQILSQLVTGLGTTGHD